MLAAAGVLSVAERGERTKRDPAERLVLLDQFVFDIAHGTRLDSNADMVDYAGMYHDLRARVFGVVLDADPVALDALAPAAPEWRVRDLVAHLSGVCADIVDGNLDGVTTDPWTAAQVDARRDREFPQLLEEWDEKGTLVEAVIRQFPDTPEWQTFVADAVTHEHDIRGALSRPGARDSEAVVTIADAAVGGIGAHLTSEQLGILQLALDDDAPTTVGAGDTRTTLRIRRFELVRTLTGRRSVSQIVAYDWDGPPHPEWLVLGMFTPRPTPLAE